VGPFSGLYWRCIFSGLPPQCRFFSCHRNFLSFCVSGLAVSENAHLHLNNLPFTLIIHFSRFLSWTSPRATVRTTFLSLWPVLFSVHGLSPSQESSFAFIRAFLSCAGESFSFSCTSSPLRPYLFPPCFYLDALPSFFFSPSVDLAVVSFSFPFGVTSSSIPP